MLELQTIQHSNYQTFKLSAQTIKLKHVRASNYSTFKLSNKNSQTFKQLIKVYTAQLLSKNLRTVGVLLTKSYCYISRLRYVSKLLVVSGHHLPSSLLRQIPDWPNDSSRSNSRHFDENPTCLPEAYIC